MLYWNRFPSYDVEPAEHLPSCFKEKLISERFEIHMKRATELPVSLVQNDDFMSPRGQGHFLLRETLDFISNDIDSS